MEVTLPESVTQTLPAKRKRTRHGNTSLDTSPDATKKPYTLTNLVQMKMQGMSYEAIGDYYGLTKQAIHEKLQGIWEKLDPEKLQAYQVNKIRLFEATEQEILSWLVKKDKFEKASLNNIAYAFTQVHQARRLEAGESTSNVALHSIVEQLERERQQKRSTPQDVVDGTLEP